MTQPVADARYGPVAGDAVFDLERAQPVGHLDDPLGHRNADDGLGPQHVDLERDLFGIHLGDGYDDQLVRLGALGLVNQRVSRVGRPFQAVPSARKGRPTFTTRQSFLSQYSVAVFAEEPLHFFPQLGL